jgi:hypothetical protein
MTGLAAVRSPVRRLIPRLLNSGDRSYLRGAVGLKQMGGGCWRSFYTRTHSDGRGALDASRLGYGMTGGAQLCTCAGAHGLSHHSGYILLHRTN